MTHILNIIGKSMTLEQGEYELLQEGASHFQNFIAVGGTIVLTNKRLIFESSKLMRYAHSLEIKLSSIAEIGFFKTMLVNPNGLALMMKDGSIEHFIFDDRNAWFKKLEPLIRQAVQ